MEKVYSNIQPGLLLHQVFRLSSVSKGRTDIVHPDNFIQVSSLNHDNGKTFAPHKHKVKDRQWNVIAQESWVVIRGMVKCLFYDLDNTFLCSYILRAGDLSVTLHGGHTYEFMEDDSIVYEYKTGPYEGQENDKVFL